MTWKGVSLAAIVTFALIALVLGFRGCVMAEDRANEKERGDWINFISQHHCSVIPTRWYETNRWQCDGFQIEHQ